MYGDSAVQKVAGDIGLILGTSTRLAQTFTGVAVVSASCRERRDHYIGHRGSLTATGVVDTCT